MLNKTFCKKYIHVVFTIFFIIAWFGLFGFSLLTETAYLREDIINKQFDLSEIDWENLLYIFFSWEILNIGLLACLSSSLGANARKINFIEITVSSQNDNNILSYYAGAVMRGFVIYIIYLSGILLFNDQFFKFNNNFSTLEYIRLAATISILSFIVGFNSNILERLINSISDKLDSKS